MLQCSYLLGENLIEQMEQMEQKCVSTSIYLIFQLENSLTRNGCNEILLCLEKSFLRVSKIASWEHQYTEVMKGLVPTIIITRSLKQTVRSRSNPETGNKVIWMSKIGISSYWSDNSVIHVRYFLEFCSHVQHWRFALVKF